MCRCVDVTLAGRRTSGNWTRWHDNGSGGYDDENVPFIKSQIVAIVKEADAERPVKGVCRDQRIFTATFYSWKSKYGGMEVSESERSKEL